MNKMILLLPVLSLLFACEKEAVVETNFLPGKWKLMKTELFENDSLAGAAYSEELSTTYYFSNCESGGTNGCEMYIEEDGQQENYTYVYNKMANCIMLNETTVFMVEDVNSNELKLSRSYDQFRSTYEFVKED